jgi:FRG domain/SET domain
MGTRTEVARTLGEFTGIVTELTRRDLELWFRGQSSAEWGLLPKLYRDDSPIAGDGVDAADTRSDDDENREAFIRQAANLSDIRVSDKWDWYFVMQHYGMRTRLLDWTDGALLGLYFALRESKGYDDAAVWVLDPFQLNKKVVGKAEVIPTGDPGTAKDDKRRYERWLGDRFARGRWPRKPVAIYPGHIMRRIGAQRSCFTIHGLDRRPLELIARRSGIFVRKIVIPSWNVTSMRRTLETCGIDETTVFPDLEGLSRQVNSLIDSADRRPDEAVYARLRPSKVDKRGVGVFAVTSIRKGQVLFRGDNDEMVWIEKRHIPRRPSAIRKLYKDFAVIKTDAADKKTRYGCPLSFNRLTVSWYLNHSPRPNTRCDENYHFIALRDIAPGEELTADYSTYSENP